jgi:hypothetical protein
MTSPAALLEDLFEHPDFQRDVVGHVRGSYSAHQNDSASPLRLSLPGRIHIFCPTAPRLATHGAFFADQLDHGLPL